MVEHNPSEQHRPGRYALREIPALSCLAIKWFGPYDRQACAAYLDEVDQQPFYNTLPAVFHDVRTWSLDVESREMERLAWLPITPSRNDGELRVAMLAGDDLAFGMLRIMASLRSREGRLTIKVFRAYRDAVDWLDLPPHDGEVFDGIERPDQT